MKAKSSFLFTGILLLALIITLPSRAQQQNFVKRANSIPEQTVNPTAAGNYSYHLFMAPNKTFGYDIFQGDRMIFHQTSFAVPPGYTKGVLTTKTQADKAALLAIEKIKKGIPPNLTKQDLAKITTQ